MHMQLKAPAKIKTVKLLKLSSFHLEVFAGINECQQNIMADKM